MTAPGLFWPNRLRPNRRAYLNVRSYYDLRAVLSTGQFDAVFISADLFLEWLDIRVIDLADEHLIRVLAFSLQEVLNVPLQIHDNLGCDFIVWKRHDER